MKTNNIPFEEWLKAEKQKVFIRAMCANTDAEKRAVVQMHKNLKNIERLMNYAPKKTAMEWRVYA